MRIVALAMVMVICSTLMFLCLALPASASPATNSGCHGHHGPLPQPAHSCCYAAQQAPAALPVAPSPIGLTWFANRISAIDLGGPRADAVREVVIGSLPLPLPAILRV